MRRLTERISSDLFLVLTSLGIACVIWLIAKGNDRGQETLRVPLVLVNKPLNVVVRLPRDFVQVTATFAKSVQAHVTPANFAMQLDWNDFADQRWCGIEDFAKSPALTLELRNVRPAPGLVPTLRDRIQRHVTFLAIDPPKVFIEAKLITRVVKVDVATTGSLPEGFTSRSLTSVATGPILVTASAKRFAELGTVAETSSVLVSTDPVDLSERRGAFKEPVRLRLPDDVELVDKSQQQIDVVGSISEEIIQKVLDRVAIVIPAPQDNVTVEYGQKSATVGVLIPKRFASDLRSSQLVVQATRFPLLQAGEETTVTLRAGFADSASVSPDVVRSTRFLWVAPRVLRVVYSWRKGPTPGPAPTQPAKPAPAR